MQPGRSDHTSQHRQRSNETSAASQAN
uniref:Predicted protein n=1 Tax=Hordeum vulgare subsp. vulgare TaxID=112509 RepID=F2E2P7_HORVV|nr:predicted protein [Hordeum vulgare subsp. vulgare]